VKNIQILAQLIYGVIHDSCIAQNKNSIICFALTNFINTHKNITQITIKYSVPGHSSVQEVDNAHSYIEKTLKNNECFSLSSIIRLIKVSNRKNPYQVLEMKKENFRDFQSCAKLLNYKIIPFTKIFEIILNRNLFEIQYRLGNDYNIIKANIRHFERSSRNSNECNETNFPSPKANCKPISKEKKRDVRAMIPWCPSAERNYSENFCNT
jgi:hypothetical protein